MQMASRGRITETQQEATTLRPGRVWIQNQGALLSTFIHFCSCCRIHHISRFTLSMHLKSVRHPEFMLLLQDIYRSLLNLVEGLQEQGRIVEEILATALAFE